MATPRPIRVAGREYKIGALKLKEIAMLQRWIREHAERPTVRATREAQWFPEGERDALRRAAALEERDAWPPSPGSRQGNRILFDDEEGWRAFLGVFFGKHQPLKDDDIDHLLGVLDEVDMNVFVAVAFGEDDLDPEALRADAREQMEAERVRLRAAARATIEAERARVEAVLETLGSDPTGDAMTPLPSGVNWSGDS